VFIPESAYQSTDLVSPEASSAAPDPTPSTSKIRVFVADITCILCSRTVGTAVSTFWPPVASVLIQFDGSNVLRRVLLRRLRCSDCGGNTEAAEVTKKLLRLERPIDWQRDAPVRGRPPKWRIAQRAAAADLEGHREA
jgi:hypothetical protein